MKKLALIVALATLGTTAQGTEIVRQSIGVRLVPGALEARASLNLAEASDRVSFCLADSAEVEPPFETDSGLECGEGLRAWRLRAREPDDFFVIRWRMPVELAGQPLVLRGRDGWFPRAGERASSVSVSTSSEIEGVTLVSNASWNSFLAAAIEDVCLLAGSWKSVRLGDDNGMLHFYSASEGFDAPAFSTLAMLRKAREHLGHMPGGRHVFVEIPPGAEQVDTHGLSAWPAGLMLEEQGRDLRLAEALLGNWWGTRLADEHEGADWRPGARLYFATHRVLDRGGPLTRTEWIDEHAFESRRERSIRREELRGAMVFHALRRVAGDKVFDEVLRLLSRREDAGSWDAVRARFAQATRGQSDWVFDALVDGDDVPRLVLESVQREQRPGRHGVRATLSSPGRDRVDVEVRVTGVGGEVQQPLASLAGGRAEIFLRTRTKPLFFEVDPDAHLLRALEDVELPPMLGLLGQEAPDLLLLGTGRGEAFLSASRRFSRTRPAGRVMLDREAAPEDFASAERVWIVGRPGEELREMLQERLPQAGERLAWLRDAAAGPPEAQAAGGESWLLAGLGRWPGEGARIVLLDAPEASGIVAASDEARAEGPATWRVRTAEGKLVEGRGPRSAQPLVRRLGKENDP